jgi:hypothetical protein
MKKMFLLLVFAAVSAFLPAESNIEHAKKIALDFLDAELKEASLMIARPDLYDALMEGLDEKTTDYSEGADTVFDIDTEIIGNWDLFRCGEIENTRLGIMRTDIYLYTDIYSDMKYTFQFNTDNTVDFFGDTFFWYSVYGTAILMVNFYGGDPLDSYSYEIFELHLSKIDENEYIAFLRDMVESPSMWADIGIFRKNIH